MEKRRLGIGGPLVAPVGFGCMSFVGFYGPADERQSFETMHRAVELGVDFWDTSDAYGGGANEEMIGRFLKSSGARITLATKGGIKRDPVTKARSFDNSAEYLGACIDASLRRLGRDHVELYYVHRREAQRPVEDVIAFLATQVKAGKIGAIGLSEVSPDTLRRANAVHPIAAVQSEYSLWTRTPEQGLIQACKELGVAFVPFGALGRRFLTGTLKTLEEVRKSEFLTPNPRFNEPNWSHNLKYLPAFEALAARKGVKPGQLALAWVLAQGGHLIPIPGTRYATHLQENADAASIALSPADLAEIETVLPAGFAAGERYSEAQWIGIERYG